MFGLKSNLKKTIEQDIRNEQQEQKDNQMKWDNYLISILFVLVGTVFVVYVNMDILFICRFFAFVFAAAGIVSIVMYIVKDVASGFYRLDLVYGVMAVFAALLFITKHEVIEVYFPIIAGCILFANGVVKLQHSIDMKRIDRKMKKVTEMWLVIMIFALFCIAAGFVAVFMNYEKDRTFFLFVGISLIFAGVTDAFTHFVFGRKVKMFRGSEFKPETEPEPVKEKEAVPVTENATDQQS